MSSVQELAKDAILFIGDQQFRITDELVRVYYCSNTVLNTAWCEVQLRTPSFDISKFLSYVKTSRFFIQFGYYQDMQGPYEFEIISAKWGHFKSEVNYRIVGVDPVFASMMRDTKQRSFSRSPVSDTVSEIATENGARELDIEPSLDTGVWIQPNIPDSQFINQYLRPISRTTDGRGGYLFYCEDRRVHFRPPRNLPPKDSFEINNYDINRCRRFKMQYSPFLVKNLGRRSSVHSYNLTEGNIKEVVEEINNFQEQFLSDITVEEGSRSFPSPHEETGLLQALALSRTREVSQNLVIAEAVIQGGPYMADDLLRFTFYHDSDREEDRASGLYRVLYSFHIVDQEIGYWTRVGLIRDSMPVEPSGGE